jgi:hypothetical protein
VCSRDEPLEPLDQGAQVVGGQVEVRGHAGAAAGRRLGGVHRVGEGLAGDAEHGLAEHLQQPAVGVPREALVAAVLGEALDAGVVEPDVQHRLHHPGHRVHGAGADAHQQRVVPVAEAPVEVVLQPAQRHRHLHPQLARLLAGGEVGAARLGGDREPGRHRQPEPRHLGEVGALAAEQLLLVLVALAEPEHVLDHGCLQRSRRPSMVRAGRANPTEAARWTRSQHGPVQDRP